RGRGMAPPGGGAAAGPPLRAGGPTDLAILPCASNSPADPALTNLRAMDTLAQRFGVPVGLSDHSPGIAVAIAAVARGAVCIEKHFTVDRSLPGPDHQASLLPDELSALVRSVREVEGALGAGVKRPVPSELPIRLVARKSLVAGRDLATGTVLRREDLLILRPGTGLPPSALPRVIGRRTARAVPADTPLTEDMLAP